MRRFAPHDNTRPEHELEIGYLRDLSHAFRSIVFDMPLTEYQRPLSTELLAEWKLLHRSRLASCKGYRGGIPRLDGNNPHEKEIAFFDGLIEALQKGLGEGDALRYVTTNHINETYQYCNALEVCQSQMIWY